MGEQHQLGRKMERNASKERTGLEQFVVGAANIVHNMVKALRRLVTAQGGGGWSVCMGGEGGISLECVTCNSSTKCRCPMPKAMMVGNT